MKSTHVCKLCVYTYVHMYICIHAYMHTTIVSWPRYFPKKTILEQISTRFEKDTLTKASMVGCCPQEMETLWAWAKIWR